MSKLVAVGLVVWIAANPVRADENADDSLKKARDLLKNGKAQEALSLADHILKQSPKSAGAFLVRGLALAALARPAEAIKDFNQAITLNPKLAEAYHYRGGEHFKLGQMDKSIEDFDRYLELEPEKEPGHWQRGISYYYAGRFAEGAKQFRDYEKIDTNDVENAVWHFLCVARAKGVDKARAAMLQVGKDPRVPLTEAYALFKGDAKPEDVLKAAKAGNPSAEQMTERLFYAHLYLGLYYEVTGDEKSSLEQMTKAVEHAGRAGYMGDVARVHLQLRVQEAERRKKPGSEK